MTTPPETTPPAPPLANQVGASADPKIRGSLGLGIALAWAVAVIGHIICGMLIAALARQIDGSAAIPILVLILLPEVAIVVLAIVLSARGKPRTGGGLLLGLLSIFAVILLLVAACFGLFGAHLGDMH
jgi:hypothetical protein